MNLRYLIPFLLVVISLAVFAPAIGYDFVGWDDDIHVYANSLLNPPSLSHILLFWRQPHEGMYIPLTFTVWATITRGRPSIAMTCSKVSWICGKS